MSAGPPEAPRPPGGEDDGSAGGRESLAETVRRRWEATRRIRQKPVVVGATVAGVFVTIKKGLLDFLPDFAANAITLPGHLWILVAAGIFVVVAAGQLVVRYLRRRFSAPNPPPRPSAIRHLGRRAAPPVAEPAPRRYPDRRLPARTGPFVGRDTDLAWCGETVDSGRSVLVLASALPVGISRLALEVAYRYRERAPHHAVVYLDMRLGEQEYLGVPDVRRAVLQGLRRSTRTTPLFDSMTSIPGQIRDLLAATPTLLFLDNVPDAGHIEGLVVPHPGLTIVAGNVSDEWGALGGGDHVGYRQVEPLTSDDAVALLAACLPGVPDVEVDPRARNLVDSVARQPGAIKLLPGAVVRRDEDPLGGVYEEIRSADTMDLRMEPIWRRCQAAYELLPPTEHRLLRHIAALPRATADEDAVEVLLGVDRPTAMSTLTTLVDGGLLERAGPEGADRYRVPRLLIRSLRAYLRTVDGSRGRRRPGARAAGSSTLLRLIDWYVREAGTRVTHLSSGASSTTQRRDARRWFRRHEPAMYDLVCSDNRGASTRLRRRVVALARVLCQWYAAPGVAEPGRWRAVTQGVLELPRLPRRGTARSWAHIQLAAAERAAGRRYEAHRALLRARDDRRRWVLPRRGQIYTNLAVTALPDGGDEPLSRAWQGQRVRNHRDPRGCGYANLALGAAYLAVGRTAAATRQFQNAVDDFQRAGDRRGEGAAQYNLALIAAEAGELKATVRWEWAEQAFRSAGDEDGVEACRQCREEYARRGT